MGASRGRRLHPLLSKAPCTSLRPEAPGLEVPAVAWADPPAGAQARPRPHRSTRPRWISVFIFSVMCSTLACRDKGRGEPARPPPLLKGRLPGKDCSRLTDTRTHG